jgi:metallo-beta-lactamase class B
MKQRLSFLLAGMLLAMCVSIPAQAQQAAAAPPAPPDLQGCASKPILERFEAFGRTGRMPPDLGRWLNDPQAQYVAPYQAFDNVYYVGVCWVSAWLIKTPEGAILIDTLHEPFVDQLLQNIKAVGVDPKDIKVVLMTHGHFDHTGGAYKLKPLTGAQFLMTQTGWNEAMQSSKASENTPRAWKMIEQDRVVKDGDEIRVGDQVLRIYETPGHTYGTASFSFSVKDGAKSWRAFTVGGLGLNAIEGSRQVEAFIASIDRITQLMDSAKDPIQVHLTTHPFSNGLTEAKEQLKTRKPGDAHPLVDPQGFRAQLAHLRAGAVQRLEVERKKEQR